MNCLVSYTKTAGWVTRHLHLCMLLDVANDGNNEGIREAQEQDRRGLGMRPERSGNETKMSGNETRGFQGESKRPGKSEDEPKET